MTVKEDAKRTIEQLRAEHAYNCVKRVVEKKWQSNYRSYAQELPATILNNGLGQAAATLLAAGKGQKDSAHMQLFNDLEDWLCKKHGPYRGPYFSDDGDPQKPKLMEAVIYGDRDQYLRAQLEAIAWLEWLKKFAVAYLKDENADPESAPE